MYRRGLGGCTQELKRVLNDSGVCWMMQVGSGELDDSDGNCVMGHLDAGSRVMGGLGGR